MATILRGNDNLDSSNIATDTELALKVALADFTGTNVVLSENGYQKLPSGLIIQWGKATSNSSGLAAVTFPISFPNSLAAITPSIVVGGVGSYTIGWTSASLAGCSLFCSNSSTCAGIGGYQLRYIAIGY